MANESTENTDGMAEESKPTKRSPLAALSGKQRAFLKAHAHHLNPIVYIGNKGVTDEVTEQTREALQQHELLKVKFNDKEADVKGLSTPLIEQLGAHHVATVGRTLILFRRRDRGKKPKIDIKHLRIDG